MSSQCSLVQIDPDLAEWTIPELKELVRDIDPQYPIPRDIESTPLKILATEKLRELHHDLVEPTDSKYFSFSH
jgi:hypothetical protein